MRNGKRPWTNPKRPQTNKTATFYQQVKVILSSNLCNYSTNLHQLNVNFNIHIDPFRRYSGSKSKVIKNRADFWTLFFPPKVKGRAFQKLYPHYQSCLAARRLEKFHEDTPASPEVIEGAYAKF